MTNRITETLQQYLQQGYELPDNINNFKPITLYEYTYNFKDMFIQRNLYKEIGSESETLFKNNLSTLIDEAYLIYYSKIKKYIDIDNLFLNPLNLTKTVTSSQKDSGSDKTDNSGIDKTVNSGTDKTDINKELNLSNSENGTNTNVKTGNITKTEDYSDTVLNSGSESVSETNSGKDVQTGSTENNKQDYLYPTNTSAEKLANATKTLDSGTNETNFGKTTTTEKTFDNRKETHEKNGSTVENYNDLKSTENNEFSKSENSITEETESTTYGKSEATTYGKSETKTYGKQQSKTETINLNDTHYLGNPKYIELIQNMKLYLYEALAYLDKAFIGEY